MPTYDYVCTACGNNWEFEQRIVEEPTKTCPKCGKDTAKRQISSAASFILKGGGWYADLYSSKKTSSTESKSSDNSSTSESKSASNSKKDSGGSSGSGGTSDGGGGSGAGSGSG